MALPVAPRICVQPLRSLCRPRCRSSPAAAPGRPVLGIQREDINPWERRAPLNPNHVQRLVRDGVKVLVQPSTRRAYSIPEYEVAGATITTDLSEADVIVGVRAAQLEHLIPDKTYVIFSHTIKAQKENMPLLDEILAKQIRLVDYENMIDEEGNRLLAFGRICGITGMVNIVHGLGLRLLAFGHHTPFMHLGCAHNYSSSSAAKAAIAALGREIQYGMLPECLGPIIFTFTGTGNVSQGAQEVFKELPHEYVSHTDLKEVSQRGDMRKVYGTVVNKAKYLVRKDGGAYCHEDFLLHPEDYTSSFFDMVARYSTCIVNGVFWAPGMPRLITYDQCKLLHPEEFSAEGLKFQGVPSLPQRLLAIADISCDLHGSMEFMTEYTTIDSPFSIYNAHTKTLSNNLSDNGIMLSTINNLSAQFPREATDYFGSQLLPYMMDCLNLNGKSPLKECSSVSQVVKDAVITYNGRLTDKCQYIAGMREDRQSPQPV